MSSQPTLIKCSNSLIIRHNQHKDIPVIARHVTLWGRESRQNNWISYILFRDIQQQSNAYLINHQFSFVYCDLQKATRLRQGLMQESCQRGLFDYDYTFEQVTCSTWVSIGNCGYHNASLSSAFFHLLREDIKSALMWINIQPLSPEGVHSRTLNHPGSQFIKLTGQNQELNYTSP